MAWVLWKVDFQFGITDLENTTHGKFEMICVLVLIKILKWRIKLAWPRCLEIIILVAEIWGNTDLTPCHSPGRISLDLVCAWVCMWEEGLEGKGIRGQSHGVFYILGFLFRQIRLKGIFRAALNIKESQKTNSILLGVHLLMLMWSRRCI